MWYNPIAGIVQKEVIMINSLVGMYFSPAGGTAKITKRITSELAARLDDMCPDGINCSFIDLFTDLPREDIKFNDETIAVIGMPVYDGKMPLSCIRLIKKLHAADTLTVVVVTYGNSVYGNSLYELYSFAGEQGFSVISAGAFIAQHPIFSKVAKNRPDGNDIAKMIEFSEITAKKIKRLAGSRISDMKIKPAPLEIRRAETSRTRIELFLHSSFGAFCVKCIDCEYIRQANAAEDANMPHKEESSNTSDISCAACAGVYRSGGGNIFNSIRLVSQPAFEMLYNRRKEPEWFI